MNNEQPDKPYKRAAVLYGGYSDVGRVRSENQDAFGKFPEKDLDLESPEGLLFIVADGMGGHKAGRLASSMAVTLLSKSYFGDPNATIMLNGDGDQIGQTLKTAMETANARIHQKSVQEERFAGMGTTCSALLLKGSKAYIAHVGDSRVYRCHKNTIKQLTDDHSVVAEMVRRGIITEQEAKTHPDRSRLYKALGVSQNVEVDLLEDIVLTNNEYFVLCSDGLHGLVEPQEIRRIVLANPPQAASEQLVALANERGGHDNSTAVVVRINLTTSFFNRIFRRESEAP